jgi:thiopurine S-methyltransferase
MMERADWESRWSEGRIPFHQEDITGVLVRHRDLLEGGTRAGRILVPLCGKSLDMVYLAERASKVIGVEFAEQAVREFFEERDLDPDVESEPARRYSAGSWTIYAADFFNLGDDELAGIDAVFDRAALVAFSSNDRKRYAERLESILAPGKKVLLVTFDYDQSIMDGPPFSVPADEVEALFGHGFSIEILESRDSLNDQFRANGLTSMSESAYLLTRRNSS